MTRAPAGDREGCAARFEQWLSDAEGRLRRPRFALVIAAGYVVFAATYLPINLFSVGRPAAVLYLPGEDQIPFLPIFVYPYVLTHLVGALLIVTIRDYARFLRLTRAIALVLLTAYTTYLVFPVWLERPALDITSAHTWLLSVVYQDKSYNHFPSLHVALSWLAVFASQVTPRTRRRLAAVTVGISLSTLFVKQHYIVDGLAGFALALAAWGVVGPSRSSS